MRKKHSQKKKNINQFLFLVIYEVQLKNKRDYSEIQINKEFVSIEKRRATQKKTTTRF